MDPVSKTPTKPIDYALLTAGYSMVLTAVAVAHRKQPEEQIRSGELPVIGLATFALSKLVAKEKVDTWVREPFVEELPDGRRRPRGRRLRYAVGELMTCTRCMGAWSAAGLVGLRLLRPREAAVVLPVLAASAGNDWLQAGFSRLCANSTIAEKRASEPASRLAPAA